MAARKKKTKARKKPSRLRRTVTALDIELPATLQEFADDVGKQLRRVEKEVEKAAAAARKEAARLLHDASRRLGRYEARGENAWQGLTRTARRDAAEIAKQLEEFLAGGRKKATRKKAKKATKKKPVARKKAAKKKAAKK